MISTPHKEHIEKAVDGDEVGMNALLKLQGIHQENKQGQSGVE